MEWTPEQYRDMLQHPKAERQFHNDIVADVRRQTEEENMQMPMAAEDDNI